MKQKIPLPEIAENVESGDVIDVLVSVGDTIEKDQPIVEVETEKAALEVPATVGGKVTEIHVNQGDTIKVGEPIVTVETEEAEDSSVSGGTEETGTGEEAVADTKEEAEEQETGGSKQPTANREPDTNKTGSPEQQPEAQARQTPTGSRQSAPEDAGKQADTQPPSMPVPAAPSVRRLARELGVEINTVKGSGPAGRISDDDVKAHVKTITAEATVESGNVSAPEGGGRRSHVGADARTTSAAQPTDLTGPLPDFSKWGDVERQTMNKVRQITSESTWASWQTIPQVTQFDKADITELETFRKQYRDTVKKQGGKLTVTAILLKAVAVGLASFPKFNASLDIEQKEIIYKRYINIGVAVDTPRGLLVPVVRNADTKDLIQLALELGDLAEKARNKKLTPDEMAGGNFTISNLGGIGGTNFTPIVYWPQVAILGVDRAQVEPVFQDGQFVPRTILPLSLSYDHRIIDGAEGARFLHWLAQALEHPFLLFMNSGNGA